MQNRFGMFLDVPAKRLRHESKEARRRVRRIDRRARLELKRAFLSGSN